MATREQVYKATILINSEQAQNNVKKLETQLEDLRKRRDKAFSEGKMDVWRAANKEIDSMNKKLDKQRTIVMAQSKTIENISTAKAKELKVLIGQINKELDSPHIKKGSEEWNALVAVMKDAKRELREIGEATKEQQSLWGRMTGFLNKNWGAITQIVSGITGLSATIRSSVQDYATMEEEMADVRKYTGMADEAVRDMNEDLKKMDTRTSREQLNRLAGSAGRLGLQSKKDIMEFVEAADMIGVALGDDLGDGAVDKIGKLAMAFGEDKDKGLKGAMLSTGSAINELVQNSSAQAGYLVDFTARVAGFGKQLGLTQAQIMGFGTVMDENLLRDEMAATAFGNMLTKMQTDTAKFAKIAGKDVKEFADLLNRDANAAILALADNLKKADPQTMMKMLDDMGLDGSRAVGVLSTLADKIDDVRNHQARATEAYEKATSVQGEFDTMNNTVQARLDKCRKQFKEMSVELGERLLPVVKYTINGASMLARTLSVLTGFVYDHWKSLTVLGGYILILTGVWNANTIAMKASNAVETVSIALKKGHALVVNTLKQAYMAWRIVIAAVTANHVKLNSAMVDMKRLQMTNIWTALITVVLTAAVAIYGAVKAWKSHSEAVRNSLQRVKEMQARQQLETDVNKKVSESIAEQKTKVEQLSRVIHSNAYSIDERRSSIKRLQGIVPEYHASISNEGKLYNDNSSAIKQYIQDLSDAATAEAVYAKKVEINKKKMELDFKENRIKGSLKAVQAYRDTQQQEERVEWSDQFGTHTSTVKTKSAIESDRQQQIHEQRLADVHSEQKVLEAEDKYLDKVLEKNKKVNELYTGKVTGKTTPAAGNPVTTTGGSTYKSSAEEKKEEEERRKREAEERKRRKEAEDAAKAESDARIAAKTHEYAMGKITYRQYIQDMAKLQQDGLKNRRDVYEKGSAEYEKLNREYEERTFKGDQQVNQMKLEDLRRCMIMQQAEIEAQAAREEITEQEKQEKLRLLEETYLADKVELYKEGSQERMRAEWELQDVEQRNRLQREHYYQQQLQQVREQYLGMSNEKQLQMALAGLDELHSMGLLNEREYQEALLAIKAQYANYETSSERDERVGADALKVARDKARQDLDQEGSSSANLPIVGDIMLYQSTMEKLKQMYQDDEMTHAQYLAAKRQATAQFCESLASQMQAAYNTVNQVMSAASSYYGAQADYEVAMTKKKYEKQIEAAGSNQKKVKKLQEKQAKEEAAIKSKYNKKQMAIQMAQAVAQTAMNAIQAYGAVLQPANPASYVYAAIAAAAAVAAGMLQIATIRKQQQAQEAGYYEGGFTGGKRYRKEAGVVHEGEFVANHQAVNNPNVLPFLNFLDQAQRNNTVGSLTAQDVSRSLSAGGGSAAALIAPVVNVQNNNEELSGTLADTRDVLDRLALQLELGIGVDVPIDGENGIYRRLRRFLKLTNNKL